MKIANQQLLESLTIVGTLIYLVSFFLVMKNAYIFGIAI